MAARSQKVYLKQSAFAGGEVSPEMYARDEYVKYDISAKTMYNFFSHLSGSASNRTGTYCIEEVKNSAAMVRLIPFQFSVEQAYMIEAGSGYFRYYRNGGLIIYPEGYPNEGDPVETITPYAEEDLFDLKFAQSADTLYICHNKYPTATLTRSSHYDWEYEEFAYEGGPFRVQNITDTTITASATTGNITLTASAAIFSASHIGSLFQISHDVTGQVVNQNYTASGTSASIMCRGEWSLLTHGTWTGKVELQRSVDEGATWETIRSYTSNNDFNVNTSGETEDLVLLRINYTHTSGTCYVDLNAYSFIMDGIVKITGVTSGTVASGTVLTDLAFTTATSDWAEGAWSEKHGFPACVKFYQNRLGLAGSIRDPLTLWLSQVGDYPNFLTTTPIQDDDAIAAPLVSEGVNAIRTMVSLNNLLAFTAGGEWKIGTGSESTALTPFSVRAVQQGYRGSSNLEPLVIGNRVLYCQEMGSIVRDLGYTLADDVYKGDDLTFLARHLFQNHSIISWAFQQEPDGIIWAVREDGILLSFTYMKEQNVWAWARHETQGKFESVAAIPGETATDVYVSVKREINGSVKRFIEIFAQRLVSSDPRDQHFVDCGLAYDNPIVITGASNASPVVITAASHGISDGDLVDIFDMVGMTELNGYRYRVTNATTNTFELMNMDDDTPIDGAEYGVYKSGGMVRKAIITLLGLDYLEGEEVTILADGSVDTPQIVTDGSITLTDYASRVHIGLGYVSILETLNLNYQMNDGTSQGRTKAVRRVTPWLESTYGGEVGVNGMDNMEPIEFDLAETWGKPAPLFTGTKKTNLYSEWDSDATTCIRQKDPLPITVLSIMTEVEMGGDTN